MFIVVCGLEHLVDLTKRSLVCYRPLAVFLTPGLWRTRFDVVPSIKTFNPTEHMGKGLKRDIWVLAGCWATVLTASTLITSASSTSSAA